MHVQPDRSRRQERSVTLNAEFNSALTDQQLLERYIVQRDESAFARLVERHSRTVWGICRRTLHNEQDAEDAFQAVFLTLARSAASIRQREAVGCWLHGVACRTALKARQKSERRTDCERKVEAAAPEQSPWSAAACRELQRILDEEVMLLAEKFRAPFILCCLEGMSKAEAAQELAWKEGTVSGRLAQARKLLQSRLARRGISLSAVLTAITLAQQTAAAAAPAILVQGTTHAVLAPFAGEATAGALSPSVVALAESATPAVAAVKVKLGLLIATLAALVTGLSLTAYQLADPGDEEKTEVLGAAVTFRSPPAPMLLPIDERVFTVAFSPDGTKLLTGGGMRGTGQLKIWNIANGDDLVRFRSIRVRSVSYAPAGKSFATGDMNGFVILRDADTGAVIASAKGHSSGVNSVAFAPDGASLLSVGLDRIAKLWDTDGLKERKAFVGHADMIYSGAFFRDGETFVTGSRDKTAKIWNVRTAKEKFTLRGHALAVEMVAVSPDDKIVATASWDRTIKFWNPETGTETGVLKGCESAVYAVAFSHDGKLLASAEGDGTVRLWDVEKRGQVKILGKHSASVFSLAFSRGDQYLASGSHDSTAKLWDMKEGKEFATFKTTEFRPILALAYSPDGKTVAMATDDRAVRICDTRTGEIDVVKTGHADLVTCVAYSRDGKMLATGSADKTVKLLDRGTQATLKGHTGAVNAVVFAPDGKKLASAGDDKTIKIWDTDSGEEWATFAGHEAAVRSLAFSLDGNTLASCGYDNTVRLWYLDKKTESVTLKAEATVRAVAFSAGHLASAGDDGSVKLWSADKGKPWKPAPGAEPLTLRGHQGGVMALAFAPGGRSLVSGGKDRSIIVWDVQTGQPLQTLKGHKAAVTALAMHPHGTDLVSGSPDTALLRWSKADNKVAPIVIAPEQKKLPDSDATGVAELLEDATDSFIGNFDNNGGIDRSIASRDEQTFFSGKNSLSVTPFHRYKPHMPGWEYQITENPELGEFRFVRFAWKRTEARGIMLQFFTRPKTWKGYYAGTVSKKIQQPMVRVADEPPRKWELVTRDLFKDFGPITITGINFSAMEGGGEAYFDHIYLGRSIEDLDGITQRFTKAVEPEPAPPAPDEPSRPGRAWLLPAALAGAVFLLGIPAVLLIVVMRRGAKARPTAQEINEKPAPDQVQSPVHCACSACGKQLKVKASLAGKSVKCPQCGKRVVVPEPESSP